MRTYLGRTTSLSLLGMHSRPRPIIGHNVVIRLELVAIAAGPAVMPLSWGFLCVDWRRMAVMTEVDRDRDRDRQ